MFTLSETQLRQFEEEGWLLIEGMIDPETWIDPIIAEYHGVLDRLIDRLYADGKISSKHEGESFSERLIRISEETNTLYLQHFDFTLPQGNIKPDTPFWAGPAIFRMLRHPDLLDAAEQIIGSEVWSNPVQHVRMKLPEHRGVRDENGNIRDGFTVWHQDNGVVTEEADETDMLTVWFPLWDAPIEKGPLAVIPGSHREGLKTHCVKNNWVTLPDALLDLEQMKPLPMNRGDVLFLTKHTCHRSLSNRSNEVRMSFDLRYNPIGQSTGRDVFPGFVARSRANPEAELHDPRAWEQMWTEARDRLADKDLGKFNRWDNKAEVCA